jgi:hypothetical protein
MSEEQSISNEGSPSSRATNEVGALVIILNVVIAGLGTLYVSTESIVVIIVAAGLVALLGLYVVPSCGHHR